PPIRRMYFLASLPVSMPGSRRWRLRLPVLWLFRCFLPALCRFSLPVAVTRKRLRDALWVFIFGMVTPSETKGPLESARGRKFRKGIVATRARRGQGKTDG